jgi:hypothetical protein
MDLGVGEESSPSSIPPPPGNDAALLKHKVDMLTKNGGPLTILTVQVQAATTAVESLRKEVAELKKPVQPIGTIQQVLLLVGAVVITNVLLGLLGVTYPSFMGKSCVPQAAGERP